MNKERPELGNLVNKNTTEVEKFQNEVLRPIIKMQHPLLILFFDNYVEKRKIDFTSLSEEKKKNKIKSIFDKDINFKNLILGLIVGHFSVDEYLYYTQNPSEFNKRVLQMIIQRLQNSISEFKI
jgi:hypothetical protein|tara:strand:+ start:206 stop:577 length:372 start_codon:yes stop_codon:yes gene_type:complete